MFSNDIKNFMLVHTIKYVKTGQVIILDNSYGMRQKQELLREIPGLVILEEKYVPNYEVFFIGKQIQFKKKISKL